MLAPISSLLLWRRMLELEYRPLTAVSEFQERYGRWSWRWRAPLSSGWR
ncbi:hypothetical protein [Actinomadura madurae]|nr:hypothetical protein [Actinomadura madurae]MCQ0010918.1 hypothetical protein [Actinomadura madurae]